MNLPRALVDELMAGLRKRSVAIGDLAEIVDCDIQMDGRDALIGFKTACDFTITVRWPEFQLHITPVEKMARC